MCAKSLQHHSRWADHYELPSGQSKEGHCIIAVDTGKGKSQGKSIEFPRAQPWEKFLLWDLKEEIRVTART